MEIKVSGVKTQYNKRLIVSFESNDESATTQRRSGEVLKLWLNRCTRQTYQTMFSKQSWRYAEVEPQRHDLSSSSHLYCREMPKALAYEDRWGSPPCEVQLRVHLCHLPKEGSGWVGVSVSDVR